MDTTRQSKGKRGEAQWYLLAYDVRHEKRLRRLHYFCKKRGVSVQRSVFLLKADVIDLEEVVAGVLARVNDKEDDVRLYPVPYPGAVWTAGRQNDKLHGLYGGSVPKQTPSRAGRFFRRLFGGKERA
ncbi:MAG: CRISPR-associated endonuclease Cas2 [Candidatus Electrothrix sp. GW3-4]|uniref:CRISPR-associated endonuclease Cas2 n=1 Tax=Candidatus Electrothrix sp. GW3-4 TaxID=3126740 RepID=UPI0030D59BB0